MRCSWHYFSSHQLRISKFGLIRKDWAFLSHMILNTHSNCFKDCKYWLSNICYCFLQTSAIEKNLNKYSKFGTSKSISYHGQKTHHTVTKFPYHVARIYQMGSLCKVYTVFWYVNIVYWPRLMNTKFNSFITYSSDSFTNPESTNSEFFHKNECCYLHNTANKNK